jgi:hypothetical protein
VRSLTRPRSASPTLMLFPEILRVMGCLVGQSGESETNAI